jgi:hypothetical protein
VFWEKSLQSLENKGRGREKERQESSRVRKGLEGKGIEEVEEVKKLGTEVTLEGDGGETMVWRLFTDYDTKNYRSCQDIK